MKIIRDLKTWRSIRHQIDTNQSIGYIPTMGNLHAGHVSLFMTSMHENDLTITSIFVNPIQFNQATDFKRYPRALDADLELLSNTGVDYCLLPSEQAIYPNGTQYKIQEQSLSHLMEGRQRPGHFSGVLTVVMKLLNLVKPHRAYFGEKDYQQFQLIQKMVHDFFMDVDIRVCPTVREASGLAYSSRNSLLNPEELKLAQQFASIFHQPDPVDQILSKLKAAGFDVEYVEEHGNRRFAAVNIGEVRLIDNYLGSVENDSPHRHPENYSNAKFNAMD